MDSEAAVIQQGNPWERYNHKDQSKQISSIIFFQDWMQVDERKRTENVSIDDLIMDGYSRVVSFFRKPVP